MRLRIRSILAAALLTTTISLGLVACGSPDPAPVGGPASPSRTTDPAPTAASSTAPAAGFITARGRSFEMDGEPFRFVGVNIYDAAATDRYSCRAGNRMSTAELVSTLQTLHERAGATVLRFWAYQTYTQGATDWSGVDRVLDAARTAGMKVVPVLEDGPGDCTTSSERIPKADYRNDTWYSAGYRVPYGNASLSYRDYVARITAHYAEDPTILGWSMMNEADTSARDASGRTVLVDFAKDVAGVIRSGDDHHLITVGTQSNGAPGASGPDFPAVYGLPEISFAEVHDWGYWGSDSAAMPGGQGARPPSAASPACATLNAPVGCSFALAARLGKPLMVGEAGIRGTTAAERTTRAQQLRAKMDAAFGAGAAGYLIWSVNNTETDGYDVLISQDDPLLEQMHEVAEGLR